MYHQKLLATTTDSKTLVPSYSSTVEAMSETGQQGLRLGEHEEMWYQLP